MPVMPPVTLPPVYTYPVQSVLVSTLPSKQAITPQAIPAQPQKPYLTFQDLGKIQPADVLIVLAHPDDEIFLSGTAAKLAKEGKSVQFAYVTNGKAGEDVSDRGLTGDNLGQERSLEVSNAIQKLNINRKPLILDFMDGETTRYPMALSETLRAVLLQTKPKQVLMFSEENGVTDHPDHKFVSKTVDDILDTIAQGKTARDKQDRQALTPLLQSSAVYQASLSKTGYDQFRRFFPESHPSWKPLQYKPDEAINLKTPIAPDIASLKYQSHLAHQSQYRPDDFENMNRFYQAYPYEEFLKHQIQSTLPRQK